jgi:hypothetical protein
MLLMSLVSDDEKAQPAEALVWQDCREAKQSKNYAIEQAHEFSAG